MLFMWVFALASCCSKSLIVLCTLIFASIKSISEANGRRKDFFLLPLLVNFQPDFPQQYFYMFYNIWIVNFWLRESVDETQNEVEVLEQNLKFDLVNKICCPSYQSQRKVLRFSVERKLSHKHVGNIYLMHCFLSFIKNILYTDPKLKG